jgi:predicted Na+-dependent transporter
MLIEIRSQRFMQVNRYGFIPLLSGHHCHHVFILSSTFLTGLIMTVWDLVAPLHNRLLLCLLLFANFILVPRCAFKQKYFNSSGGS